MLAAVASRGVAFDRRQLLAGGFGALALGTLGARLLLGPPDGADAATGPLRLMGNPYNEATYDALGAAYGRRHGALDLRFSARESEDVVRQLLLAAFTGGALPDAAFLNGDVVRLFADRGLLAPLAPFLEARPAYRVETVGSVPYALPFGVSVPVILVNRRLAAAAGAEGASIPRDWAGLLALAGAIDRRGGVTGGFIEHDSGGAFAFLTLMASHGVPLMDAEERRFAFAGPAGEEALGIFSRFGAAGQARSDMSRRQARRAFVRGRIGIFVTMSSIVAGLAKTAVDPFAIVPLPLVGPAARLPSAGPVGVVFAREEARRRAAFELLRFAATAGQPILAETSGYLPANPAFAGGAGRALSDYADPARITGWYSFPGRSALKISDLIQDVLQQLVTLALTPRAAIARILDEAGPLLDIRR